MQTGELSPPSTGVSMRLCAPPPVTVLHAPAGFGKTCAMVSEFERLRENGVRVAWIAGEALSVSGLSSVEALAAIQALVEDADAVFFDDADHVTPAILAGVATTILYSSPRKRLLVGARRIEDLQIARRIAQGAAEIIPGDLLAFQRQRLNTMWHRTLGAPQIRAIHHLAEGWPAPSQMLARWLAGGNVLDDAGLFISRSQVGDYIDQEVLGPFPGETHIALSASSLHHEFDQELLDRLSPARPIQQQDIAANLSSLVGNGSGPSFRRYNSLLRRHLRCRFDQLPRNQRIALLGLVSDWAADRGDVVSAAHLASIAGDETRIVKVIVQAGGLSLWLDKGYDNIRALVEVAGEALIRSEPRLQLLQCVVLMKDGRVGEADRLYRETAKSLPLDVAMERDAALVKATLLIYGCRAATIQDDELFNRLAELCGASAFKPFLPSIQAIRHSQQAEFGAATAAILEGINHARAAGSSYPILFLDFHTAGIALAQGELADAAKILSRARRRWQADFAEDKGAETVMSALWAQLDFERGRTRQAARHLKLSAHRLPDSEAWLDIYVAGFEPMIRLLSDEHGITTATAAIDRSRQQLRAQSLNRIADLLTCLGMCIEGEAWLFGQAARPEGARIVDLPHSTGELATWQEREFGTLATAYQALIAGDVEAARRALDELVFYARDHGLRRTLQRGLLLRTATLDRVDDPVAAQQDFDEAVAIARSTGLRRAFCEFGGPSVADRLAALQARSGETAADTFLKGLAPSRRAASASPRRTLTKRERQILGELAAGGSDKIIARRLDVTEHAVRFHLKNIYVKLGVHDRAGAIEAYPAE
ncbi:MAG: LuxR C-terminal-related transcriptional regulator [Candidatus Sphingomonas phytovorans]|nr:LuxR C-terminal-related transcriptional regulator [Sphingomonas sp.]WEK00202.1 MAG: LuxR C-terminal-related transcriptional regulator [Sphingomonas sp.]